jgi:hypothetical protein
VVHNDRRRKHEKANSDTHTETYFSLFLGDWDTEEKSSSLDGHCFECDFVVQIEEVDNDEEEAMLASILMNVMDEEGGMVHLNSSEPEPGEDPTVDVALQAGDQLWMQIAETPKSFRDKLWQLERAYCQFVEVKSHLPPNAAVICLSGDENEYKDVLKKAQDLWKSKTLTNWKILNSSVQVFVLYTQNRSLDNLMLSLETNIANIAKIVKIKPTIVEIKSDMHQMDKSMAEIKSDMATKKTDDGSRECVCAVCDGCNCDTKGEMIVQTTPVYSAN